MEYFFFFLFGGAAPAQHLTGQPPIPKKYSPAWFALFGAFVLCIADNRLDVEEIMHLVEWDMLLFFAALFVMVEGAVEVGLINRVGGWLAAIIRAAPPEARTTAPGARRSPVVVPLFRPTLITRKASP